MPSILHKSFHPKSETGLEIVACRSLQETSGIHNLRPTKGWREQRTQERKAEERQPGSAFSCPDKTERTCLCLPCALCPDGFVCVCVRVCGRVRARIPRGDSVMHFLGPRPHNSSTNWAASGLKHRAKSNQIKSHPVVWLPQANYARQLSLDRLALICQHRFCPTRIHDSEPTLPSQSLDSRPLMT
jgi:hypothetical protein